CMRTILAAVRSPGATGSVKRPNTLPDLHERGPSWLSTYFVLSKLRAFLILSSASGRSRLRNDLPAGQVSVRPDDVPVGALCEPAAVDLGAVDVLDQRPPTRPEIGAQGIRVDAGDHRLADRTRPLLQHPRPRRRRRGQHLGMNEVEDQFAARRCDG